MGGLAKAVLFFLAWWLALGGWWILLVGTNAGLELVGAACGAAIGATLALGVRHRRLLSVRFQRRWLS
jgi:hypothetical protein